MPNFRAVDIAWAILVLLTLCGWVFTRSGAPALIADAAILGIAAIKARTVCLDYLGLREASRGWRRGIALGVGGVAVTAWVGAAACRLHLG